MSRTRKQIPWLDQRDGWFYVFWTDPSAGRRGQTKRLSLRTRDAEEALLRYAAFLTQGGHESDDRMVLTCGMVLDSYLEEHAKTKVRDVRREEIAAERVKDHFGSMPVRDVGPEHVGRYVVRRGAGEIGPVAQPQTCRRELTTLKSAINHAVRARRLSAAEVPYIALPSDSEPRDRWLTLDELGRLIRAARGHYARGEDRERLSRGYRLVMLLYYTASRRGAIERLTWFQVDLDKGRIALDAPGARKTKKRRPVVSISPKLLPVLKKAHEERRSEYVLDTPDRTVALVQLIVKAAGLEGVTAHTLRHSRATHLLQAGASIWSVAKLLGDSVVTVERVYGHHCADHLSEVLAADATPESGA